MNRSSGCSPTRKCRKPGLHSPENLERKNDHEHRGLTATPNDLFGYVPQGKIIEAITEFYDKHVKMQENANPPTIGQAANIEREKQFMSGVKEWKGFNVTAQGVGNDVTFYECNMDFIATNGQPVGMEQVVVAKWMNSKIVHERYYNDTSASQ